MHRSQKVLVVLLASCAACLTLSCGKDKSPTEPDPAPPPGVVWVERWSGTDILLDVVWFDSKFIAVSERGNVYTSPDGIAWTVTNVHSSNIDDLSVVDSQMIAVFGLSGTHTSPDGFTWTQVSTQSLRALCTSDTLCVAFGGGKLLTSTDLITWTERRNVQGYELRDGAWSGSRFVLVNGSYDRDSTLTSEDGIQWTARELDSGEGLNSITWTGTRFFTSGSFGLTYASSDGITWTEKARGNVGDPSVVEILWTGTQLIAVGGSGLIVISDDGDTWTIRPSGTSKPLQSVAWSGERFVVVAQGIILSSP